MEDKIKSFKKNRWGQQIKLTKEEKEHNREIRKKYGFKSHYVIILENGEFAIEKGFREPRSKIVIVKEENFTLIFFSDWWDGMRFQKNESKWFQWSDKKFGYCSNEEGKIIYDLEKHQYQHSKY